MKHRFVHALQSFLPGFFTEPAPIIAEPAQLIEHKAKANARTIKANAPDREPVVVKSVAKRGAYAVLDAKRKVLVAHIPYEHAKDFAKKYAIDNHTSPIIHKMA